MSLLPSLEVLSTPCVDKDAYDISWYQHQQELNLLKASNNKCVSEEELVRQEIFNLESKIFTTNKEIQNAYTKIAAIQEGKENGSVEGFMNFIKTAASKIWEWIKKIFFWIVYQIKTIGPRMRLNKIQRTVYSVIKFGKIDIPYVPTAISNINSDAGVGSTSVAWNMVHKDLVEMLNAHIKMFACIEGTPIGYANPGINNLRLMDGVPADSIGRLLKWLFEEEQGKANYIGFAQSNGISIDQLIRTIMNNVLTNKYMAMDKAVIERNQKQTTTTTTNIISRSEHEEQYIDQDGNTRTRFINDGDSRESNMEQRTYEINQMSVYTGVTFLTGQVTDACMDLNGGWDSGAKYNQLLNPRTGLFVQYELAYQRILNNLNDFMTKITDIIKNNKNTADVDILSLQQSISFLIAVIGEANKVYNIFFGRTCYIAEMLSVDIDKKVLQ